MDKVAYQAQTWPVRAEALSIARIQEWFTDTRTPVRRMKVAHHPESSILVISLWQGDHCTGTFRLSSRELARLQHMLVDAAASDPGNPQDAVNSLGPPTMLSRLLRRFRRRRPVQSSVLTLLRSGSDSD